MDLQSECHNPIWVGSRREYTAVWKGRIEITTPDYGGTIKGLTFDQDGCEKETSTKIAASN